jgi:biotin carboxyl carrier protein
MKNYTITVNGNVYEVSVEEGATGVTSAPVAQAPKAAPKAPVVATPVKAASTSAGSVKVNSPMPGKILAIKANAGQSIKKGQVICVLEAMKMENEIVAPSDGTVASINVAVGSSVEAGEVLATLN